MISNRGWIRTVERKANFSKDILKIPTIWNVRPERIQYKLIGILILNSLGENKLNPEFSEAKYTPTTDWGIGAHFDRDSQAGGHLSNR